MNHQDRQAEKPCRATCRRGKAADKSFPRPMPAPPVATRTCRLCATANPNDGNSIFHNHTDKLQYSEKAEKPNSSSAYFSPYGTGTTRPNSGKTALRRTCDHASGEKTELRPIHISDSHSARNRIFSFSEQGIANKKIRKIFGIFNKNRYLCTRNQKSSDSET